jgi:hypothetical protein
MAPRKRSNSGKSTLLAIYRRLRVAEGTSLLQLITAQQGHWLHTGPADVVVATREQHKTTVPRLSWPWRAEPILQSHDKRIRRAPVRFRDTWYFLLSYSLLGFMAFWHWSAVRWIGEEDDVVARILGVENVWVID